MGLRSTESRLLIRAGKALLVRQGGFLFARLAVSSRSQVSRGDNEDQQQHQRDQQLDERPVGLAPRAPPVRLIADADRPLTTARRAVRVRMEAVHHRSSERERSHWIGHQLLADRGRDSIHRTRLTSILSSTMNCV